MKKYFKQVLPFVVIPMTFLSLIGCATVVGDNMRTVRVDSHPQGAGVYVEGQRCGTTPTVITLPNYIYGGKTVVVKKEGYLDQAMTVNTKFQPCGLWNLLFWPGFIIDGATGNTVKIDPIHLNLNADLQTMETPNSK